MCHRSPFSVGSVASVRFDCAQHRLNWHFVMAPGSILDREEYIEQAYFFRVLRERLATNMPTQDVLSRIDEEILSTTRLPVCDSVPGHGAEAFGAAIVRLCPSASLLHAVSGLSSSGRRKKGASDSVSIPHCWCSSAKQATAPRSQLRRDCSCISSSLFAGIALATTRAFRASARTRFMIRRGATTRTWCVGRLASWSSRTCSICGQTCTWQSNGAPIRVTSRPSAPSSGKRKGRLRGQAGGAILCFSLRPFNGS